MASVQPSAHNSDSLGSSSVRWGDIFAQDGDFSGTLTVSNLTVTGTSTSIETVSYQVTDPVITLAQSNSDASEAHIGLQAERGSVDAWFLWNESLDAWVSYTGADTDNLTVSDLVGDMVQGGSFNIDGSYEVMIGATGGVKLSNIVELDSTTANTVKTTAQTVTSMNSLTELGDSSSALTINSTSVSVASLEVGASTPFSDASGVLTLQNVDGLDATTEATIEGAIDTLDNLVSIGQSSNVLTVSNSRVDMASLKIGESIPFSDASGVLTLQNVDSIDATTEATIEGAIDSLPVLSSIGTDAGVTEVSFGAGISTPSILVGGVAPVSEAGSQLTLTNISALDSTTEATIEDAIDTLDNLAQFGASGNDVAFVGATFSIGSSNLKIGQSFPFSDSTGTLTLQNVDALDSTSIATITTAVEANATEFEGVTALGQAGSNLTISSDLVAMGSASLKVGDSIPFSDSTGTLTLQNVDALDSATEATVTSAVESNATQFTEVTEIGKSGANLALSSDLVAMGGSALKIGQSVPFSDSTGALTLQNVDSLDSTTQATVTSAVENNATQFSGVTEIGSASSALAIESLTVTLGASALRIGQSSPFSDNSGTLTLQNVDVLDATTEATIEGAIDTLANLTSVGGTGINLSVGHDQVTFDGSVVFGASTPFSDASGVLTLQNVDAIDSTTQSTLEGTIADLSNITSIGKSGSALSFNGSVIEVASEGIQIGDSVPFADATGTLTLQNVDALDATTEATIENAIDSLPSLTSMGASSGELTVNATALVVPASNGLKVGSSVPFNESAGDLQLLGIDYIDPTTRDTISGEIQSLPNVNTLIDGSDVSTVLTINGGRVDVPSLKIGASIPFADSAGTLTLQNVDALDATSQSTIEGAIEDLPALTAMGISVSPITVNALRMDLPAEGLKVGDSIPFSDSTGTLTLQNVDALDATTEATIEGAIDTLANLTAFGATSVATAFNGSTLDLPSAGLKVGDSIPFNDASGSLTLQNVDALDATTEATIESAIDALPNLASIGTTSYGQALDVYGSQIELTSNGKLILNSGASSDSITVSTAQLYLGSGSASEVVFEGQTATINNGSLNFDSDTMVIHATNNSVGFGTDSPSANCVAQFNGDVFISSGSAIKNAIDSNDYLRFDTDLTIRSNGGKLLLIPEDNEGLVVRDETGFDAFTFIAKDSDRQFRLKGRTSAPAFISASGVGSAGDTQGSMVHYNGDLYFCIADYDSGSPSAVIWKKISLASI